MTFWKPTAGAQLTTRHIPKLLAIPTSLIEWAAQGERTAYDLVNEVTNRIADGKTSNDVTTWKLVLDWGVFAAQPANDGDSILSWCPDPVFATDAILQHWGKMRLSATLGPTNPSHQHNPSAGTLQPQQQQIDMAAMMATAMGTMAAIMRPGGGSGYSRSYRSTGPAEKDKGSTVRRG